MKKQTLFALRGTFAHTPTMGDILYEENKYLVCKQGICQGFYSTLPERYAHIPVHDYTGMIIIPGFTDAHLHAPQYSNRGIGKYYDQGWDWFTKITWPEESCFSDREYAALAYTKFIGDLRRMPTTRAVLYGTIHRPSTELLMDLVEQSGLKAYVGKVNMDLSSIDGMVETTEETLRETRLWLHNTRQKYQHVKPILTPRFIPSCTNETLREVGRMAKEYGVPVQSHLSEDYHELTDWIRPRFPGASCSGAVWDQFGLFGTAGITIMAHCIYSPEGEIDLMRQRNIFVAHCPSTMPDGFIAPIKRYIDLGIPVGLGSDMSGGASSLNLLPEIGKAVELSKYWWAANYKHYGEFEGGAAPLKLSIAEAFYLATKGGGSLFGSVGSFEDGYECDAVVIDDGSLRDFRERPSYTRLERIINMADERHIVGKYVAGEKMF